MNELIQIGQLEGKHEQSNRIYSEEGICPTVMAGERKTCAGGYVSPKILTNSNKIIREIIPQQVRVRKYEVDIERLKLTLRNGKLESNLTNKKIAESLNEPLTLVEHWFRNDSSFSIPNENIWLKLKELLNIQTDEFDESVMTFEIRDGLFDKANRVYDSNGIAPTLTCVSSENERYKVYGDMNLDKSGYTVCEQRVDEGLRFFKDNICGSLRTIDSCGDKRIIEDNKLINKGGKIMWKNKLEKLNFEMEEIRVFDIFAGIGALHKSLSKLGVPVRITNLSEVDIDAIISYSAIHIENFKDLEFEYPSDEDMKKWLIERNIGYDFEKGKSKIPRLNKDKLKLLYKGSYLLNNLGDVSKIDPNDIEDFDIMNLSFCCQDISNAGKQKGLRNEDGTPTRSGLIVPSLKLARAKKPKYIMIENVKGLIQKKFIDDFYDIINELTEMGYNCYYPTKEDKRGVKSPTCLNSKNFGVAQNRERIFVYAIRKDIDDCEFEFDYGYDRGVRLKHMLEDIVDEKYYLSDEIQKRFKLSGKEDSERNDINTVGTSAPECRTIGQRDITYGTNGIMSTLTATDYKQPKQIIDNGAIRGRYNEEGKIEQQLELRSDGVTNTLTTVEKDNVVVESENELNMIGMLDIRGNDCIRRVYDDEEISPTLTTMEGGNRQPKVESEYRIRKLTPLECWRLQGFDDEDFYKAKELGISDSQLYKQAGNSITVNVLYYQFKNLFKKYIVK